MTIVLIILNLLAIVGILAFTMKCLSDYNKEKPVKAGIIEYIEHSTKWVSPEIILKMLEPQFKHDHGIRKRLKSFFDSSPSGAYVIINEDKKLHYVGSHDDTYTDMLLHFMGKGDEDIFSDFNKGDRFSVLAIPLIEAQGSINTYVLLEDVVLDYLELKGESRLYGSSWDEDEDMVKSKAARMSEAHY